MLALLLLIPLAIGAYTDFKRLAVSPGILGLIFVVGIAYNVLSFPEGMNPFAVAVSVSGGLVFMLFIVYKGVWLRPMDAACVWSIGCVLPFFAVGWLPIWCVALGFTVPILYTLYWLRKYLGAPKTVELPFFTCFLIGYGVAITLFWDKVQMFKYILP